MDTNNLINNITNNSYNIVSSFLQNKDERMFILDPFTCIIRLAILSFKPIGTKISIHNNKISYNYPNVFQGPIRWTYGDNRNDLHNLFNPLVKSTEWYDLDTEPIQNIFNFAVSGLEKLKLSYTVNSIICHSINHYIDIIKKKKIIDNDSDSINELYNKFKTLWSTSQIDIVNSLLEEAKQSQNNITAESYIEALENILIIKEENISQIVNKHFNIF